MESANREADQRLCFRYTDSTIPLLPKYEYKPLAIFYGSTAWFMSDLVGNPEDWFSHEAHLMTIKGNFCQFSTKTIVVGDF